LPDKGAGLGDALGMGVGGIGYAPAVPTPIVTNAKVTRLRHSPSRAGLARLLFLCGALALFDELLDFLPTFLSDAFVEVRAIAITSGFATFLSTLLTDLLVEFVAVCLFGRQSALAPDLFVELGSVLMFDGLAAFLTRLAERTFRLRACFDP